SSRRGRRRGRAGLTPQSGNEWGRSSSDGRPFSFGASGSAHLPERRPANAVVSLEHGGDGKEEAMADPGNDEKFDEQFDKGKEKQVIGGQQSHRSEYEGQADQTDGSGGQPIGGN